MSKNTVNMKEIMDFPNKRQYFIQRIMNKLNKTITGKRKIMCSDIINLVIREIMKDDLSKQQILCCNYNIKFGEIFVEL